MTDRAGGGGIIRPSLTPRSLALLPPRLGLELRGEPVDVTGITHDSRAVQPGDIYAAWQGFTVHGAAFAHEAVQRGAVAVLTDAASAGTIAGVPVLVADDPRAIAGDVAAWAYGYPADDLVAIGITGTNGKTTTAYLVDAGLRAAGHATGIIGTVGTRIADADTSTARTTPEATDVHALLAVMRERGVTAVTMEVSSHALALHRVGGVSFAAAGFTNLTRDHLDFHGSMEEYFTAKAALFGAGRSARGVACIDDEWGRRLAGQAAIPVTTASASGALADWQARVRERRGAAGTLVDVRTPEGAEVRLDVPLPGEFNVANALLAFALLRTVGVPPGEAAAGIGACAGVPGRLERVDAEGAPAVFVDYAHTPDAVARVLDAARSFTSGRVIVVLGCGGDRDRDKRPLMGREAASRADMLVITDDNPRGEDPASIRQAMREGAVLADAVVEVIGDRREAIARAIGLAGQGDCVLVLGKGHESGQDIGGVVHPFDDRAVARTALGVA